MRSLTFLTVVLLCTLFTGTALADDQDDVRALVDEYCRLESDLQEQAKLMTDDRIMITGGRRQTDQATNMKVQIANQDMLNKLDPGAQLIVTAEDPIVRVYGDTAIASFYRFWDLVPSAEAVKEAGGNAPSAPPPNIVTLVLVKQAGEWKIAHTHMSPLHPSN